ncbi:hypothetical protein [Candidatus Entotheonella palauensis]|uniref:hypothetical protein n=1 Tax=Candidatus Entotheonella palauensis TaxID=93172 RepID=UPI000B7EF5BC|nr:hypothetical protein [Candidatus Entotheonella palauensis]
MIAQHAQKIGSNHVENPPVMPGYCFSKPVLHITTDMGEPKLDHLVWRQGAAERAAKMMHAFSGETSLEGWLLRGLRSHDMEAIARILAVMVCAEESAINIFQLESERLSARQSAAAQRQLLQ